jgi:hypothetical protein
MLAGSRPVARLGISGSGPTEKLSRLKSMSAI